MEERITNPDIVQKLVEDVEDLNSNITYEKESLATGITAYYWKALKLLRVVFENVNLTYTSGSHTIVATIPEKYRNFMGVQYNQGVCLSTQDNSVKNVMYEAFDNNAAYPEWYWGIGVYTTENSLNRFRGFIDIIMN